MKVHIDTAKVLEAAMGRLEETYTLDYVAYDDKLTEEQIQRILQGEVSDVENEILEQWQEYHHQLVDEQYLPQLVPDPVERAALSADSERFWELVEAIRDRDDSTLWADLVRNTRQWSILMRYRLGKPDEDMDLPYNLGYPADPQEKIVNRWARKLARMAGVDFEPNEQAFRQMVIEQSYYGGTLWVVWYGSPGDLIEAVCADTWQRKRRRTITWTNPELVLLDRFNGSGHDESIVGTITKPWDPERCEVDSQPRFGYGWDKVAGVVKTAYKCEWSIDYTTKKAKAK